MCVCVCVSIKGGGPRNALGLPLPRGSQLLRLAASRGGGPEMRSGTVQSLKCCPCQQKRAARLPSAAPGSIKGGPRNALGHRPEPQVCPCQQKRGARLPSAAPGSIKGGGPRNALGHRPEPQVLPLPAETSREAPVLRLHQGRGPRNALGHRPEPEVLPLPAETSREAPKCCQARAPSRASSAAPASRNEPRGASRNEPRGSQVLRLAASRGGGPRNALGHRPEPEVLPLPAETSREASIKRGGPETRSGTVPLEHRERTCVRLLCVCLVRLPLGHRERRAP